MKAFLGRFDKSKKSDTVLFTTNPKYLLIIVPIVKNKEFNLEGFVHELFPDNLVPASLICPLLNF